VVRFVFTVEDLARMRFAVSPMWEAVHSLSALRDPSTAALHVPWLRSLQSAPHINPAWRKVSVSVASLRSYSTTPLASVSTSA